MTLDEKGRHGVVVVVDLRCKVPLTGRLFRG
jgi:hypothetical protein